MLGRTTETGNVEHAGVLLRQKIKSGILPRNFDIMDSSKVEVTGSQVLRIPLPCRSVFISITVSSEEAYVVYRTPAHCPLSSSVGFYSRRAGSLDLFRLRCILRWSRTIGPDQQFSNSD